MKVWLPYVHAGSGSDVYTERLAAGLRAAGHAAVLTPVDRRWQYLPWRYLSVPAPADACVRPVCCRGKPAAGDVVMTETLRLPQSHDLDTAEPGFADDGKKHNAFIVHPARPLRLVSGLYHLYMTVHKLLEVTLSNSEFHSDGSENRSICKFRIRFTVYR